MDLAIDLLPSATFRLPLSIVERSDRRGLRLDCPTCDERLDLHQPDPDEPGRLLGTCPECGAWHRIELAPDRGRFAILTLPGHDVLRAGAAGPAG